MEGYLPTVRPSNQKFLLYAGKTPTLRRSYSTKAAVCGVNPQETDTGSSETLRRTDSPRDFKNFLLTADDEPQSDLE